MDGFIVVMGSSAKKAKSSRYLGYLGSRPISSTTWHLYMSLQPYVHVTKRCASSKPFSDERLMGLLGANKEINNESKNVFGAPWILDLLCCSASVQLIRFKTQLVDHI